MSRELTRKLRMNILITLNTQGLSPFKDLTPSLHDTYKERGLPLLRENSTHSLQRKQVWYLLSAGLLHAVIDIKKKKYMPSFFFSISPVYFYSCLLGFLPMTKEE